MKRTTLAVCLTLGCLLPTASFLTSQGKQSQKSEWKLIWRDEFNAADGTAIDNTKWTAEVGGHGWGNNELQFYTKRIDNAFISKGQLNIKAMKERFGEPDKVVREYTSPRLITKNKFSVTYGRIEARLKLPFGQGIWPAFWMLGEDIDKVGWPACGEIDIMEFIGKEPSTVYGTLHGPGYSGAKGLSAAHKLTADQKVSDEFHVFAVEWEPNVIRFYYDDILYATRTTRDLPAETKWVFDRPYFILLNLAVGGNWPGSPDATTTFPQTLLVDYVRAYQRQ